MSAKNKRPRKSRSAPEPSGIDANPERSLHPLARQKMAENDVENGFFRLNRRQQAALPAVALAPTITQAATDSGVSQRTLYRWFRDPDFREAVSNFLHECANLASQQFQGQTLLAASVFAEFMKDAAADPALRLRAAHYSTSYALRIRQADQLASDVRDIKEALDLRNT